MQKSNNTTN